LKFGVRFVPIADGEVVGEFVHVVSVSTMHAGRKKTSQLSLFLLFLLYLFSFFLFYISCLNSNLCPFILQDFELGNFRQDLKKLFLGQLLVKLFLVN
jgi:hypothetical protein